MKFAPRNKSHVLVFVWAFGYMSASHLYRMYIDCTRTLSCVVCVVCVRVGGALKICV